LRRVQYKGYEIHAVPFQSGLSKRWEVNIYVSVDRGHHVELQNHRPGLSFDTEMEALRECFLFGQTLVDEKTSVREKYLVHS
jgi:hypothetical protein